MKMWRLSAFSIYNKVELQLSYCYILFDYARRVSLLPWSDGKQRLTGWHHWLFVCTPSQRCLFCLDWLGVDEMMCGLGIWTYLGLCSWVIIIGHLVIGSQPITREENSSDGETYYDFLYVAYYAGLTNTRFFITPKHLLHGIPLSPHRWPMFIDHNEVYTRQYITPPPSLSHLNFRMHLLLLSVINDYLFVSIKSNAFGMTHQSTEQLPRTLVTSPTLFPASLTGSFDLTNQLDLVRIRIPPSPLPRNLPLVASASVNLVFVKIPTLLLFNSVFITLSPLLRDANE